MKRRKLSRKTKRILVLTGFAVMAVLILVLSAAVLRLRRYRKIADGYAGRFFEGTTLNGLNVSGMTAEEAEAAIREATEGWTLELRFRGDHVEKLTAEEIGYRYVPSGEIGRLLEEQDPDTVFHALRGGDGLTVTSDLTVEVQTEYDPAKLAETVQALPELQEENMTAPVDAHMAYQDARYVVVPEEEGSLLHADKVQEAVRQAVEANADTLDLTEAEGLYEAPRKTAADIGEKLQKEADTLNELVPGCVTYTLPHGKKMVLDGPIMRTWLEEDYDGKLYRDEYAWEAHLAEYVEKLADSVYTVGKTRTFPATGIGDIQVSGGNYGYEIDQEAELEKLREELAAGEVVTREPVYASWETSEENDGFGSSYVEIDCSRQHMWIYVDGKVELETDVVTGLMTKKMSTPSGTCLLMGKERDSELVGEGFEYRVVVSYWMPFNGGVGMHDAWWRSEFGGDIYLWDGSNGCINMPTDMAEKAFDIVTYEMPIVVYYSEPFKLEY